MSSKKDKFSGFRPYYKEEDEASDPNSQEILFMPSTVETIDFALFDWLTEEMNIFCTTNEGWKRVPIIWSMAERAYQIKDNKDLRDKDVFILPAISVERVSLVKDPSFKGVAWSHIPRKNDAKGGAIYAARRINQLKTSNYANAKAERDFKQQTYPFKNKDVIYDTLTIPIPTYVVANYKLTINTEYQQQMNEIFTPFMTYTGQINNFFIHRDGHKFEGFIQNDFALENNISNLGEEERKFVTTVDLKILGYLIGSANNDDQPKMTVRESAIKVEIGNERVMLGDKKEH